MPDFLRAGANELAFYRVDGREGGAPSRPGRLRLSSREGPPDP